MARRSRSTKRLLLLTTLALFATVALAQSTADSTDDSTNTVNDAATSADATTASATGTSASGATSTKTSATVTSATATKTATSASSTSESTASTTKTSTASAASTATSTGTATTRTVPTLSSSSTAAANTYPAATVPPTSNAPFMQKSSMPEGTVFIAVGSILGACGVAVLVWRAVVACLLHRSVKRAALAQHMANDKMAVPGAPPAPFYKYTDHESQGSFGAAAAAAAAGGRGVRRTTRGPVPSATPSQTNLFFSPTANTGSGAGNRSSTFLPSGFYAAGQGAPQGQSQGHSHNISMTNLRPDSMAASRTLGHTPPESPGLTPRQDPVRRHPQMSTSSLNLNQAPTGRAPSAYLQDLLDEDPSQFPPTHSQTWSQSPPHSRI